MSAFLTEKTAQRALAMTWASVLALIEDGTLRKPGHFHIVVGKPNLQAGSLNKADWCTSGVLYQYSHGSRQEWAKPYDQIALAKGYLSWFHGLSTQIIQTCMPHLLEPGDTTYYGSVVRDGFVVAVSGFEPCYDQMLAEWVHASCKALCIEAKNSSNARVIDGFLPSDPL